MRKQSVTIPLEPEHFTYLQKLAVRGRSYPNTVARHLLLDRIKALMAEETEENQETPERNENG